LHFYQIRIKISLWSEGFFTEIVQNYIHNFKNSHFIMSKILAICLGIGLNYLLPNPD